MFPLQPDPEAVGGHRRQLARPAAPPARSPGAARIVSRKSASCSSRGVDQHQPAGAVQRDEVSRGDLLAGPARAHHRRRLARARDDGGVAGLAAQVGDEARHPPASAPASPRPPARGRARRRSRPSGTSTSSSTTWPIRLRTTRSATKSTSARRSRKYSSGMLSNRCLIFRATRRTAHSALMRSAPMSLFTSSTNIGSCSISRCASRMSAWSWPSPLREPVLQLARAGGRTARCAVLNRISSALHLLLGQPQLRGAHPLAVEHEGVAHRHAGAGADALDSVRLVAWRAHRRAPVYCASPNRLAISSPISSRHASASSPLQRDLHLHALRRRQHQHAHDGLAVDRLALALERDLALVAVGDLHQLRRRPGVQPQRVDDARTRSPRSPTTSTSPRTSYRKAPRHARQQRRQR